MVEVHLTFPLGEDAFRGRLSSAMENAYKDAIQNLANGAFQFWQMLPGKHHLRKTRRPYENSLKFKKVDDFTYELYLHNADPKINFLATAIEVGVGGYSMKPGMMKSPSAFVWSRFARKMGPGKPKIGAPFVNVPFFLGDAIEQKKPDQFRRISKKSAGFQHPGFSKAWQRTRSLPFRELVINHIKEQAPIVLGPVISRMSI